ncbi:sporulation protein YtxC [Thermincola ferriacetica]|uniref:Sporulation protein YtxC n=1 Tax=Thermincola ferriacetica TaxID=281456 RepID=A0A0L6W517_9FIRM|nr:putative sporulation protein YtxC [Thermincola ferriacetica]KNZ70194.1 sporulation protein YtxC [Thermincola ferriacetica]
MSASFCIGAANHIDYVKEKLDQEFRLLENDGIKISCEEGKKGDYVFLEYNIADYGDAGYSEEDTKNIFKHYVANAVSDIIVNNWERTLLEEIIRENYYYFSKEEQQTISEFALKHLNLGHENGEAMYEQLSRKSLILRRVLEYLQTNNNIVIEGFIRFRLKEYIEELTKIAEKAADDYLLDKEYKEFLRLLKYFVDIQEPRLDVVQVLIQPSGMFKLLDASNKSINCEYLDGFIVELGDSELNYEDLLISALITIAPTTIILHCREEDKMLTSIDTIVGVFGERVKYCGGCELCRENEVHLQKH